MSASEPRRTQGKFAAEWSGTMGVLAFFGVGAVQAALTGSGLAGVAFILIVFGPIAVAGLILAWRRAFLQRAESRRRRAQKPANFGREVSALDE